MRIIYITLFTIISLQAQWNSLYSPERSTYTNQNFHKKGNDTQAPKPCVFCKEVEQKDDAKNFIIKRFKHTYACLNPFPYRHGHMLVLPKRHVAQLDELRPDERAELMEVVSRSVTCLKKAFNIDGANVGINIGKAAGASKPDHLHVQIVPRWDNDTNWIHIIGKTAVITIAMEHVYQKLQAAFSQEK